MPAPSRSARLRCAACLRPQQRCLCALLPRLSHRCPVLVLQHPTEHRHPLNTARLAVLGLQQAQLWVGEQFLDLAAYVQQAQRPCLLFPGESSRTLVEWREQGLEPDLLVVPDGTWRKASKIVHRNPCLQALPRICLQPKTASRYRLRKAPHGQALSTIEALAQVLGEMQPGQDYQPLLRPFERLIDEQIEAMGAQVFERNYRGR